MIHVIPRVLGLIAHEVTAPVNIGEPPHDERRPTRPPGGRRAVNLTTVIAAFPWTAKEAHWLVRPLSFGWCGTFIQVGRDHRRGPVRLDRRRDRGRILP